MVTATAPPKAEDQTERASDHSKAERARAHAPLLQETRKNKEESKRKRGLREKFFYKWCCIPDRDRKSEV